MTTSQQQQLSEAGQAPFCLPHSVTSYTFHSLTLILDTLPPVPSHSLSHTLILVIPPLCTANLLKKGDNNRFSAPHSPYPACHDTLWPPP